MTLFISLLLASLSSAAINPVAKEIERIETSVEIATLMGPDQALRFGSHVAHSKGISWEQLSAHPHFARKLGKIDAENERKIKTILARIGFPKISEYGTDTSRNAWLLVQHMDKDVAYQEKILGQLTSLWPQNEVGKEEYALLYDRVQVNRGRLQRYGSQGFCVAQHWEPRPMEDPTHVDERRAEMGLSTMDEYRKFF